VSDKPSVAELRAHARAIDDGLEHHQQRRRLWLVTKPYKFFCKDWTMPPTLVLARNAVEARKLVRDSYYARGREVPADLESAEVSLADSRILDEHDEEVRLMIARDSAEREAAS
jgi:hypothetical protein